MLCLNGCRTVGDVAGEYGALMAACERYCKRQLGVEEITRMNG